MLKLEERDEKEEALDHKFSVILMIVGVFFLIVSIVICVKKYEQTKTITSYRTVSQNNEQQTTDLSSKEAFKSYKVYEQEDAIIIIIEKE